MDLERRLGEGQLAQLGGPSDLASDQFELRLGLLRTAQNEWAQTTGAARQALLAYAQGVNDDIAQVRADGDWPSVFTLAGAYPKPWTPYDTGPSVKEPLTPVAADVASSAPAAQAASVTTAISSAKAETTVRSGDPEAVAEAAGQLLDELSQLPANQIHEYPDSNAWAVNGPAVNGPAVNGGGALLGGDPHLPQTLPSVWYEVALSAPGYQVTGATVPGVPGVLLGHNAHIAWSLTDTQNEATLYYAEQVRGDEYYWRGAWRKMTVVHYTISASIRRRTGRSSRRRWPGGARRRRTSPTPTTTR
jgi:penicillin G amidase